MKEVWQETFTNTENKLNQRMEDLTAQTTGVNQSLQTGLRDLTTQSTQNPRI